LDATRLPCFSTLLVPSLNIHLTGDLAITHLQRLRCKNLAPVRVLTCLVKRYAVLAYDLVLDAVLESQGIEMIAPHRRRRKKPKTQDGRKLRRCNRRWKVERLFAWLGSFRRLVVRYEYRIDNFLGFVHLGCSVLLLRCLLG
jgi:hypothetical protein